MLGIFEKQDILTLKKNKNMSTLDALGLIFIGIGIGFALTKGWQLHKSIKEKVRRDAEETERKRKEEQTQNP
jgi:hypothetical protein